jgi:antitoxin VapB
MATSPPIASENLPPYVADTGARHVRLFKNGANQAVRIPKEFELPGKDAVMRREGNRLIIEVPEKPKKGTLAALVAALDAIRHLGPIDEPFPDVDEGLLPLDDIIL